MPNEERGQLILAQNQYAFVQDATKGNVQVYAGPHASGLRQDNDVPVTFDKDKGIFVRSNRIEDAIRQNPLVSEGHYIVLENPALDKDGKLAVPRSGSNATPELEIGKKINIPGPTTFPLWPGQFAQAISGHHLRSNQYLVVRVYNADEANKHQDFFNGDEKRELVNGQLIVIKGTDLSFFIPPTGYEVLQDKTNNNEYVRDALTLERLEYAILLDEDGNKRYERGPQVVFPEATEKFVTKPISTEGGQQERGNAAKKFKAVELNDQMGLYIKVIADYEEEVPTLPPASTRTGAKAAEGEEVGAAVHEGRSYTLRNGKWYAQFKTGEELFVTGKEQRIYYPRPEHALIEYDDPNSQGKFKRQRYYGITIPKGEGRYALDKVKGQIITVKGPQIFLPDPRTQVVVRRVLGRKEVILWYPNNVEAMSFNEALSSLTAGTSSFVSEANFLTASADINRAMNRMTASSRNLASASVSGSYVSGEAMSRGGQFTPPPMLTLNTKYDGVPTINVWTGYAVQIVDRSGNRRVVVGPATELLEYDETLEMLALSTGKPKTTDKLYQDVYLRVDNNLVSDIVSVETKDLVKVQLKMSYRVNFRRDEKDKWFSVENYVKYLCDHLRSLLKAAAKQKGVKELLEDYSNIIRNTVLGDKKDGESRTRYFKENGMEVYDVEVFSVEIEDKLVAGMLKEAQEKVVKSAITLSIKENELQSAQASTKIDSEILELNKEITLKRERLQQEQLKAQSETAIAQLVADLEKQVKQHEVAVSGQKVLDVTAAAELARTKAERDLGMVYEKLQVDNFKARFEAISPNLVQAMLTLGKNNFATMLSTAVSRSAVAERTSIQSILERTFRGTVFENILDNLQEETTNA